MNQECVLVTGAAGFIGYALACELARQGRRVIGYDLVGVDTPGNFKSVIGDLNDVHRLHRLFKDEPVTSIVHSGAVSGPMLALDNPHSICHVNLMGTVNILEVARIYGVRRFVYCSSGAAYGERPLGLLTEESPLNPQDIYGASKASGEHIVQAYAVQFGLDAVSLRICWVYGPRRRTRCVIREMIEDAIAERPTQLDWGLGSYRQYIFIDDVVSALIAALDQPNLPQPVYNVAGDASYVEIEQVAETVRCVLPNALITLGPAPDPFDSPRGEYDTSAAKRDFGFSPRFSLLDGIEAYSKWIRQERNNLKMKAATP